MIAIRALDPVSAAINELRAMGGAITTMFSDILEAFGRIVRQCADTIAKALRCVLPLFPRRSRRPRRRSSRRAAVIDRRLAAGLTIEGKNPHWEDMGICLTRAETRAFQVHIAEITRRHGVFAYLHVRECAPYVHACRRHDAKVARAAKYAAYEGPFVLPLGETDYPAFPGERGVSDV